MYSCDTGYKFSFSFENTKHSAIIMPLIHTVSKVYCINQPKVCESGGIGRRTGFRFQRREA